MGNAYAWDGFTELVDSVVVVHNGSAPLIPVGDIAIKQLWTGPPGVLDPAGAVWEEPSRIRAAENAVHVLDPRAGQVISLSWTGLELNRLGRLGEGPDELRRPAEIVVMDPFLTVLDAGAIKRFDSGGQYHDLLQIPTLMPYTASRFNAGQYLIGSPSGWHLLVLDELTTVFPPFPPSLLLPDWSGRDCSRVYGAGGAILRLNCVQPYVQVIDSAGRLRREFGFDRAAEPATETDLDSAEVFFRREAARAGMRPGMVRGLAAFERDRARLKPRFRAARATTAAVAVWEQEPPEFGDGSAVLHLFSSRGLFLATILFPDVWVDFDFNDWRIVALVRDLETDLVTASAYEIGLPDRTLFLADSLLGAMETGGN